MAATFAHFKESFRRLPTDKFQQRWEIYDGIASRQTAWEAFDVPEGFNPGGITYVCVICGCVHAKQFVRVNGIDRHRFYVASSYCSKHDVANTTTAPLGLLLTPNGVNLNNAPKEILMHDLLLWDKFERKSK